jgi:hypothetical protein
MDDSYDLDAGCGVSEDNEERKSVEEIWAGPAQGGRPLGGSLLDARDCGVGLSHQGVARVTFRTKYHSGAARALFDGFRMKP